MCCADRLNLQSAVALLLATLLAGFTTQQCASFSAFLFQLYLKHYRRRPVLYHTGESEGDLFGVQGSRPRPSSVKGASSFVLVLVLFVLVLFVAFCEAKTAELASPVGGGQPRPKKIPAVLTNLFMGKLRVRFRLADISWTPSGTFFFREVHPASETASQNDQNKAE